MVLSLVDQLSQVLSCKKEELYVKLHEPKVREQALAFLKLVKLETTHLRFNRPVKFAGLTYSGARYLMAFRGFLQITVAQYYYAKHKLILENMEHPCIIQMPTSVGDHYEYFPLEVLRVVPGDEDRQFI
jgi:hypothetical protein